MGLHLQTKLLRALEERSFEPVGSTRTIPLSARIIASTNGDLAAMIREKQFRLDLYYRLKGVAVTIPAAARPPGRHRAPSFDLPGHVSQALQQAGRGDLP